MHERALILRQDVLGRVRSSPERRLEVVREYRRSGLSGAQFARLAGMKYPTLMAWVKRDREGAREATATLIESCRTHGLDPFVWLRDVLTRLTQPQKTTKNRPRLTPHGWAAARNPTPAAALA